MAIRPDYTVGTLTLTSGSANFTTSGSALQTAAVQAGDAIIAPSGHVLIIASITGQNSGTLFLPCPAAAAGSGLPLRIRFQPDGSRYQGAVRNLIDLLSSGNVEALAGLTGAAGKVPVFTGPGAMDLQDYIADPSGSLGKLAALTLAANKILNTDSSGNLTQSNRVGTVSQSGGVPTGALIEKGGNANGYYTRWEDGTQIAWGRQNFNVSVPAGQSTAPVLTPPIAFATGNPARTLAVGCFYTGSSGVGNPLYTLQYGSSFNNSESVLGTQFLNCGVNPATAYPGFTIGSSAAASLLVSFHTIGRWF